MPLDHPIARLLEYQGLDERLRSVEESLERSEEAEAAASAARVVKAREGALKEAMRTLEDRQKRLRRLELEIDSVAERVRKHEAQLFDGSVNDARGLANLQERIKSEKAKKERLEEEALSLMEQIEEDKAARSRRRAAYEEAVAQFKEARSRLSDVTAARQDEASSLRTAGEKLRATIPSELLSLYEALTPKMKRPVATVDDRNCGGCNVTLPTSMKRPKETELARCPHCSRILFWP